MGSSLLKKLSLMERPAAAPQKQSAANVKLYEETYPAPAGLRHMDAAALELMGYEGETFDPERTLFIDTETTGLSGGAGTVAFLIGVGRVSDDRFVVKQYLMPDYSCETEMLLALKQDFDSCDTVIHFNGKRFDMPLIRDRLVLKRIDDYTDSVNQLDLLYPSRTVWKLRLGTCRLGYIETKILGLPERDDIPGGEIPQRYFESIKTQDVTLLNDVIEHNRQDIYTLALLLVKLNECYSSPEKLDEQLDLFSMGRHMEKHGEIRAAEKLYLKASLPRPIKSVSDIRNAKYRGEANLKLYILARRRGEYDACELILKNMIKRRQLGIVPVFELCKLYEHRLKRFEDALIQCNKLLETADTDEIEELTKRRARIKAKIDRKGLEF
ncbi:MAG: ribonuclease H-like domain-containing protein [Clostridiales bacterium]|nr:ribonuclease H-like domain-containing protein [Clostridiales bacterium]